MRTIYLVDQDHLADVIQHVVGEPMHMQRLFAPHRDTISVSAEYVTIKDETRMYNLLDGDPSEEGTVTDVQPYVWKIEMP